MLCSHSTLGIGYFFMLAIWMGVWFRVSETMMDEVWYLYVVTQVLISVLWDSGVGTLQF